MPGRKKKQRGREFVPLGAYGSGSLPEAAGPQGLSTILTAAEQAQLGEQGKIGSVGGIPAVAADAVASLAGGAAFQAGAAGASKVGSAVVTAAKGATGKIPGLGLVKGAGWVSLVLLGLSALDALYKGTKGEIDRKHQDLSDNEAVSRMFGGAQVDEAEARDEARLMGAARSRAETFGAFGEGNADRTKLELADLLQGKEDVLQSLARQDRPSILDFLGKGA